MDIDKVGARVAQTPLDQRIDLPPVADIAEIVETEIAGIVGADRDQPVAHDLGNSIEVLEPAAAFGMNPDWARGPIDPVWAAEMVGAEQHGLTANRFGQAMPAGRWVIGDLAMQMVAAVVNTGLAKAAGGGATHRRSGTVP